MCVYGETVRYGAERDGEREPRVLGEAVFNLRACFFFVFFFLLSSLLLCFFILLLRGLDWIAGLIFI